MKKFLSVILSMMLVASIGITALAADTDNNAIVLGADKTSKMYLDSALLKSGEEYRFPISVSVDGKETVALNDDILDDYSLKVSNTGKGKTMTEMQISKSGGVYYLIGTVKAGWPATQTDEEYTLKFSSKGSSKNAETLVVEFQTGYEIMEDAYIDNLETEDEITVNNETPVFTTEQLERIARTNNYRKVVFENENWRYTANVTDMKSINMLHNSNGIKEILTKYEDNGFEFLTFPAGPVFKTNGLMEIDVSGFAEDFNEKFFVYRYLDNKLTLITSSYNAEDEILSFNTNTLGRFVITDNAINDAAVVNTGNSSNSSSNNNNTTAPVNPSTGAAA